MRETRTYSSTAIDLCKNWIQIGSNENSNQCLMQSNFTFKVPSLNSGTTVYYSRKLLHTPFLLYSAAIWMKARVVYYVNNWVYTTNHKRIAVNYFWFVIFSGICGMVLATIIRLEMAYPGVGILAGDSLQYLSVVTAHAVIMVFFMIMPLLFGAFGNFLLPTQLGVHDVAFPRLNSVAFWFLPGGLLMLCQLVCLDRRYQRMNCFNIREIQTLLKTRFYADLLSESHQHIFLNRSTPTLRFKTQDLNFLNSCQVVLHKYGILTTPSTRNQAYKSPFDAFSSSSLATSSFAVNNQFQTFNTLYYTLIQNVTISLPTVLNPTTLLNSVTNLESIGTKLVGLQKLLTSAFWSAFITNLVATVTGAVTYLTSFVTWVNFQTVTTGAVQNTTSVFDISSTVKGITQDLASVTFLATSIINGFKTCTLNLLVVSPMTLLTNLSVSQYLSAIASMSYWNIDFTRTTPLFQTKGSSTLTYSSDSMSTQSQTVAEQFQHQEVASDYRNLRLQNPIFKYDFKLGNYMPDDNKRKFSQLLTSIHDLTTGVKKPNWTNSPDALKYIHNDLLPYLTFFSATKQDANAAASFEKKFSQLGLSDAPTAPFWNTISYTSGFFNFYLMSMENATLNQRYVSLTGLEQKFSKMFLTSSLQQRVHGNWRELKFTREAWRCRLLSARHQNTMHRRYLDEDSVVWAIERNAKDVLPGWAMITPFSARTRFTAIGKVDLGLMGVFLVLNSSIVASSNFLITYRYLSTLNNRKMRDARSFFTEGVMVASWMMIAANPMLAIAILMLLSDRHWQTSFFDYSGGGDTVMFQHMFWFFGHPEVYVIMIPTFGFNNTILSFYLRKRVSARASLLYSMYTIAFLGFFVWGHHMYMVGLAHTTRMLFSTLTVMISVPAATKLMHWCVTLVNSSFAVELPFVFQLLFIFFFVSGGISGMAVAHTGMDILFHDSFYVVGHFHVMLAGAAMFGSFGAFYFYFPAIWGVKYSRIWGYLHCLYYLIGQVMTVVPMIWLGYSGMPRRVLDYPASMGGWHSVTSAGHLLSVAGMIAFFVMLFDSLRQGRAATRNSFGIARFNTRLNFYLFTGARMWFVQRKGWYLSRFNTPNHVKLNSLNYTNYEPLELTLLSYNFTKK